MRVVKFWIRLPTEVGDVPPLEIFNTRLDGALSNLAEDLLVLCRGWIGQHLKVLSHPNNSMILCLDVWGSQRGVWEEWAAQSVHRGFPPAPSPLAPRATSSSSFSLQGKALDPKEFVALWGSTGPVPSHLWHHCHRAFQEWEQLGRMEARWLCVNNLWQIFFGTRGCLSPAQHTWPSCKAWGG